MNFPKRIQKLYRRSGWKGFLYAIENRLVPNSLWLGYNQEALICAGWMDFTSKDLESSRKVQTDNAGEIPIHSITWLIPDFSNPFYGGIHTILQFAAYLAERKGVKNQFGVLGKTPAAKLSSLAAKVSPYLANSRFLVITSPEQVAELDPADAGICTLWATAFHLLYYNQVRRKFYFLQDDESRFYPAGTISALVQATWRFGFTGLANTPGVAEHYKTESGQKTITFLPGLDRKQFFPAQQAPQAPPFRIFWYARPDHPRNGFELCAQALMRVKLEMGERVEILAAGDSWDPARYRLKGVAQNLGNITLADSAELYRSCHLGLVMMFTRHPSYLPIQLMACGCPVITNANPDTRWLLQEGVNSLTCEASASMLADRIISALADENLRRSLITGGLKTIQEIIPAWEDQFERMYSQMQRPLEDPCE